MKKNEMNNKKKDYLFIAVAVLLIAVFFALSLGLKTDDGPTIHGPSQLPTDQQNTVDKLIISEILTNNSGFYYTAKGNQYDYIELYNGKEVDLDLTGYGLSDDTNTVKWLFPDGTIIPAKGYLVVCCAGENLEGLYTNFRLKSTGGETVILVNKGKKIIDAIETMNTGKNQSICRDGEGNLFVCQYPTPGFANTQQGLQQYYDSIEKQEDIKVVINEYLVKNAGNYQNENQRFDGYIELKNISDEVVNLADYSLSNDEYIPFKKMLPEVLLQPGEVYLLYCGDAEFLQSGYIGFELESKKGVIILSCQGKIVETCRYQNLENGLAMIRLSDGSFEASTVISPGYENDLAGVAQFQEKYFAQKSGLLINEVMSDNTQYLAQNGDRYYDWVELWNHSDEDILLSQYYLSTKDTLDEYQLPEVTLKPNEYIVIMCSGDVNLTNQSYYHAPFKISTTESLYLSKDGICVDSLVISGALKNTSYGFSQGRYYYFSNPTPKQANGTGLTAVTSNPIFQMASGVYNDTETLSVEIAGSGTIYYTTDGSRPTTSSKVYTGPITLKKTTVLKALAVEKDKYKSEVVTASYILNENHSLPVMSISLPQRDFNYLNENSWSDDDIPCTAEFFEGDGGFQIDCAISCFGGNSRNMDKKSYALKFNRIWGDNNLVYPLFDHRDNSVYESIVLRQGSNDWTRTIFRDVMATSLMDEYLDSQDYKACVLYIDGQYWGIYNIREKVNAAFIASHYNVSKESVNIVNVDLTIKTGDNEDLLDLIYYMKTHDLSNDTYYEYVCSKLDVVNVCDYWIAEMFCVNPDVYNVRYFNSSELDGGKWKYVYYDMDHAFRFPTKNYYYEYLCNPNGMEGWIQNVYDNTIPKDLFENKQFCDLWLERLAYHLHHDLTKENLKKQLDHFIQLYQDEIERDRQHWSNSYDPVVGEYPTMSNYYSNIEVIKNFINTRQEQILKQTKSYFGLSDAKMKEIFTDLW